MGRPQEKKQRTIYWAQGIIRETEDVFGPAFVRSASVISIAHDFLKLFGLGSFALGYAIRWCYHLQCEGVGKSAE
jgi:hypothetical protein